jgi:hypothetical protein
MHVSHLDPMKLHLHSILVYDKNVTFITLQSTTLYYYILNTTIVSHHVYDELEMSDHTFE